MANIAFISDFLATVEGPCQTTGYIPCNLVSGGSANYKGCPNPDRYKAMGASGVTIATGCDLGQTDRATLIGYGLDPAITDLFAFYYGKKRDAAIAALHARPLSITLAQAKATDAAVHGGYMNRFVRPAYESDSGLSFDSIPKEAQAVIMSLCFQKGVGGTRRGAPKTWTFLCKQNWRAASDELINGFMEYAPRRRKEGELLRRIPC